MVWCTDGAEVTIRREAAAGRYNNSGAREKKKLVKALNKHDRPLLTACRRTNARDDGGGREDGKQREQVADDGDGRKALGGTRGAGRARQPVSGHAPSLVGLRSTRISTTRPAKLRVLAQNDGRSSHEKKPVQRKLIWHGKWQLYARLARHGCSHPVIQDPDFPRLQDTHPLSSLLSRLFETRKDQNPCAVDVMPPFCSSCARRLGR